MERLPDKNVDERQRGLSCDNKVVNDSILTCNDPMTSIGIFQILTIAINKMWLQKDIPSKDIPSK